MMLADAEARRIQIERGLPDSWWRAESDSLHAQVAENWPDVFKRDAEGGYQHTVFWVETPDGEDVPLADIFDQALRAITT